jgi:hypothetical protein
MLFHHLSQRSRIDRFAAEDLAQHGVMVVHRKLLLLRALSSLGTPAGNGVGRRRQPRA